MTPPVIAVVDDDPALRAALARLIRSVGYRAVLFDGGQGLLDMLESAPPDCVVTDLQMPGLTGLDLLRLLKAARPDLPVMAVTAFPSDASRERALASGAFAYLAKPFDADEFERCLADMLAKD